MSLLTRVVRRASRIGERGLLWVSHAVERQFNTDNFIAANQTPFEVIHQEGLLSVRRYPPLPADQCVVAETHRIPVLLVPPLAADPLNFDLLPQRSLVRFLLARGFRVYLADFGSPDEDHAHLALADYTTRMLPAAIAAVRRDSGERKISLLGYCMGGLFCLIYAGWSHDRELASIVTIASPIDADQAGIAGKLWSAMRVPARLVRRYTGFRIHNLDPGLLNVPGWVSSIVFKLTNPMGTITGYIDLLLNLWDRDYVTEYQTMSTWFNRMHDYPGGIVQDFVVRVGLDNALARGRIGL
ncbi:MAG TPA: alpha/beta fold hydrolase, partial [Nevskiaceae bacterium]|nr:alpha/beta fold hydrolase [Nevskiaceae bacterium]